MVMVSLAYVSIQMASASTESKDDSRCLGLSNKVGNCLSALPKEECKDIANSEEFKDYKCFNSGNAYGHGQEH